MRQLLWPRNNRRSKVIDGEEAHEYIDASSFIPIVMLPNGTVVYTDPGRIQNARPIGRTEDGAIAYQIYESDGTTYQCVDIYNALK